jgi:hypothetical protein
MSGLINAFLYYNRESAEKVCSVFGNDETFLIEEV